MYNSFSRVLQPQVTLKNEKSKTKRRPLEALDVLGSWRRATEFLQNLTPSTRTDVVTLGVASRHRKSWWWRYLVTWLFEGWVSLYP